MPRRSSCGKSSHRRRRREGLVRSPSIVGRGNRRRRDELHPRLATSPHPTASPAFHSPCSHLQGLEPDPPIANAQASATMTIRVDAFTSFSSAHQWRCIPQACGTRSNEGRRLINQRRPHEEDDQVSKEQWRLSNVGGPIEGDATELSDQRNEGTNQATAEIAGATGYGAKWISNPALAFSATPNESDWSQVGQCLGFPFSESEEDGVDFLACDAQHAICGFVLLPMTSGSRQPTEVHVVLTTKTAIAVTIARSCRCKMGIADYQRSYGQ